MQDYSANYSSKDIDYYDEYLNDSASLARRAYSRYALSLVIFNVITYVAQSASLFILTLILGSDKAYALITGNIYVNYILSFVPMYLVAFPLFYLMVKNMRVMKRVRGRMKITDFLATFFISQGVMMVGDIIGTVLNKFISVFVKNEVQNPVDELVEETPIWLIILVVVIIGPIIEELMFRKLMIDRLSPYGTVGAIIFSSVTFGLFHGNLYQFFYAAMLGVILGYIYAKTGKLRYSVLLHMLINLFGSALGMLVLKYFTQFIVLYGLMQYAIAGLGIALLIFVFKTNRARIENLRIYRVPDAKLAEVSVFNVGTLVFLAASIILFASNIFA